LANCRVTNLYTVISELYILNLLPVSCVYLEWSWTDSRDHRL